MDIKSYSQDIALKAKNVAAQLASLSTQRKNDWLLAASTRLLNASNSIQDANQLDLSNAKKFALSVSQMDRLTITPKRLADMANSMVLSLAISSSNKNSRGSCNLTDSTFRPGVPGLAVRSM